MQCSKGRDKPPVHGAPAADSITRKKCVQADLPLAFREPLCDEGYRPGERHFPYLLAVMVGRGAHRWEAECRPIASAAHRTKAFVPPALPGRVSMQTPSASCRMSPPRYVLPNCL